MKIKSKYYSFKNIPDIKRIEWSTVVLIFEDNNGLWLDDIQRDSNGKIISGWVINGHWDWNIKNDNSKFKEILVPDKINGGYNFVIEWARNRNVEQNKKVPIAYRKKNVFLYGADPNCFHELDPYNWNGMRCLKCNGWYCA